MSNSLWLRGTGPYQHSAIGAEGIILIIFVGLVASLWYCGACSGLLPSQNPFYVLLEIRLAFSTVSQVI